MVKLITPMRAPDNWGSGYYGASRGTRKHRGIDCACWPNSEVFSPVNGEVTKLGYAYGDDLSFRYVEITEIPSDLRWRIFYVEPSVGLNDMVTTETIIGKSQDLRPRYKGITPHVHLGVMRGNEYLNPELL